MTTALQRLRPMLGTFVAIECSGVDIGNAESAIETAFATVAAVDRLMHPMRAGSDLAAIRNARPGRCVRVHPWTWQVLELSRHLNEVSGGLFDPCTPNAAGRMNDVELPESGVVVCRTSVAIDLGGIAKGFAVDQAVAALMNGGCGAGAVNAGGDVRVFGPQRRSIWVRVVAGAWPITLLDQACAVSDAASTARPPEHRGFYGYRRTDGNAVARPNPQHAAVVVAPTAAVADALTKIVLLSHGPDRRVRLESILAPLGARSLTAA